MPKALRIFWRLFSMDAATAKKAPPRRYKKELKVSDFEATVSPEAAMASIHDEYGTRPEGVYNSAHQFAIITDWRIFEQTEKAVIKSEKFEEQSLLTPKQLESCKKLKDETRPW